MKSLLNKTVKEIREYFLSEDPAVSEETLAELERDPRSAVRQLARSLRNLNARRQQENVRLEQLLQFESELWKRGYTCIAGVDEAGMAPLAGPVVAAAVILPHRYKLEGLNDSKKILNEKKRARLAAKIKTDAVCWAVGCSDVAEIDRINIYRSGLLAMSRAVEGLSRSPDFLLVDARTIPHCPFPQKGILHGDALSASIAAASILAKTTRDAYMAEMDKQYPGYGFAAHKGYPTPEHLRILRERGPLPIHRKTFGPVKEILSSDAAQGTLFRLCPRTRVC